MDVCRVLSLIPTGQVHVEEVVAEVGALWEYSKLSSTGGGIPSNSAIARMTEMSRAIIFSKLVTLNKGLFVSDMAVIWRGGSQGRYSTLR